MTRTFIALEMNSDVQQHLARVIHQVSAALPSGHWVDPLGIHITLAFLGELDDARLQKAIQATQEAVKHTQSFTYRLAHLGLFGSTHYPSVLWMGLDEPSGALHSAHHRLQQELAQRNFSIDSRSFSPHLTLARFKKPLNSAEQQKLQSLLSDRQAHFTSQEIYPVTAFEVMKSELSRSGAHYTVLQRCHLADSFG
jgi:RNA 2',3'-cyclic 3'-phosphodiesterase